MSTGTGMTRRATRAATLALLAAAGLAVPACGKGAKGFCPQLDICGGNPASDITWMVTDYCQLPQVRPSQSSDITGFTGMTLAPTVAPPQPNPVVAQQTTSGDWCSNLEFKDNAVTNVNLWHQSPLIPTDPNAKPSIITIFKDHTYSTTLFFQDQDSTYFAPHCLLANGDVMPTCDVLASGLTDFYKPINASAPPSFSNITCTGNATVDGCTCTYVFNLEVRDSGGWSIDPDDPTILVQDSAGLTFNGTNNYASAPDATLRTSFCAEDGVLELSGVRGGSLFNVQGLRTLILSPMPVPAP
jgi:hypothetical protein